MPPWEKYQPLEKDYLEQLSPSTGPWLKYSNATEQSQQAPLVSGAEERTSEVGRIFTNRANELADNIVAYKNNEISSPELGLRFIGKAGAGTANDLIGAGINEMTPNVVKRGLSAGAQKTADAVDNTDVGQFLGDKLLQAKDAYGSFTKQHPRLTGNVESLVNIATFVPTANAIESGTKSAIQKTIPIINKVEAASQNLPGILGDTRSGVAKIAPLSDDAVRAAARNAYQDVNLLGGGFTPHLANDASSILQRSKVKPFAGDILTKQDKAINEALSDYDTLAGKTLSLDDYKRLDSSLGDKAAEAFVNGRSNEGRVIAQAQDQIRDLIKPGKLNEKYISGSREGIDTLTNDAIPLWSTQSKLMDLQKIADRAAVMDNPTTAIRTGYRNLMLSKRFATYPKDVQKLIVKAADTGVVDDLLGVVGSRLNQIAGGAIGGVPGYAASTAISTGSRGIRNAIRNNRANKVVSALVEPVRPSVEKYNFTIPENVQSLSMQEIMKMPPAQARAVLAQMKASKLATAPR